MIHAKYEYYCCEFEMTLWFGSDNPEAFSAIRHGLIAEEFDHICAIMNSPTFNNGQLPFQPTIQYVTQSLG